MFISVHFVRKTKCTQRKDFPVFLVFSTREESKPAVEQVGTVCRLCIRVTVKKTGRKIGVCIDEKGINRHSLEVMIGSLSF